jgi:thiamine-monophosphate kinase
MLIGPNTLRSIGEKVLIEHMLRPLFNPSHERNSVGDDCAAVDIPDGCYALLSTDRVPADLIAFKTGVLTYRELGRYLGTLNMSDVAACGGTAIGLLFNCGLPETLKIDDFIEISTGLQEVASQFGAQVIGGDVTASQELSLSATVIGYVQRSRILRRSGARVGDSVFVSRAMGMTPVALDYCLNRAQYSLFNEPERTALERQFKSLAPELLLGQQLAASADCTSCIDNTDGLGQSLLELARESGVAIIIEGKSLEYPPLVWKAVGHLGERLTSFAFGPGADFGLVGTLRGCWTNKDVQNSFSPDMHIIGEIVAGKGGTFVRENGRVRPLEVRGWNYFSSAELRA